MAIAGVWRLKPSLLLCFVQEIVICTTLEPIHVRHPLLPRKSQINRLRCISEAY
jgi:hypothetical protein